MMSLLRSPRQWIKFIGGLFLGYGTVVFVSSQAQLVMNTSESLPIKSFVQLKHLPPANGDYTLVESPRYGKRLIKQVIGMPGDEITYDAKGILFVNGKQVGIPKLQTTNGRKLTPIPRQKIPDGHVFLYAPHPMSFDSRYAELGLVHESDLQGRLLSII